VYPKLLLGIAERVFTVDGTGKARLSDVLLEESRKSAGLLRMLRDLLGGARSM